MKIIIPGGSGQVGTLLARACTAAGHAVTVLSRTPDGARTAPWRVVGWDARGPGDWCAELDGADVVINLAGRSVDCRYHARNRAAIMDSRVDATRAVGHAIAACRQPPPLWLQMSTATIYAHRFDAGNDEATGILGGDEPGVPDTWRSSIAVAKAWERACDETTPPGVRVVTLRSAMVMSPDRGGIFDVLVGMVRKRLGGRAGDGRQFVSWIHHADFTAAIAWLIARPDIAGVVNLAAPTPLSYAEFMAALRRGCGVGFGLPASRWMLEVGAFLMRTETELVLKSRRVVPGRLLDSGFAFRFHQWSEAAADLCQRWRERRAR